MLSHPGSLHLIALVLVASAFTSFATPSGPLSRDPVCREIARKVSSASAVYYSGEPRYEQGISHWSSASTQHSKCVVEPGKEADVAEILKIVGRTRTPFAVKGGGHGVNPGFSSTPGIHISMTRFSDIKYQRPTQTAEVGTGLVWDDVYAALEPFNRTVVGGRVSGVGVAGLALGGGYSWKTNQYGLTVDNIQAFRLVKPDGTITTVTHANQPDLFFALKGTQNNFGIVTKITFKTVPQTAVWGGLLVFDAPSLDQLSAATAAFHATVTDPKASMIATYGATMTRPLASVLIFYDAATPPAGTFDSFLSIPALATDVRTRSYLSLVQSSPVMPFVNPRAFFQGVPHVDITPEFLGAIMNELVSSGQTLTTKNNTFIGFAVEPFRPDILSKNNLPSAYPGTRTKAYLPFNVLAMWPDAESDGLYFQAIKDMAGRIRSAAVSQGQVIPANAPLYPNYALDDSPLEQLFGANLPKLRRLKRAVDPKNHDGGRSDHVCAQIAKKISPASAVFYPGDPNYEKAVSHWTVSSSQRSLCVVEPGKEDDVAAILKIVGRTRTPFAVKGGGHTSNPGFSSTKWVHISMTRFSDINYKTSSKTAEVGMGLLWDDVYAALEAHNRTVVGGRASGIGVAGLSLGGGYSWLTNQYGLTVDTIEAFRLVKPDGSICTITHAKDPELFFALKGTQNNFGIVTKITFKTFTQNMVWGGNSLVPPPGLGQLAAATAEFHKNVRDPKASMLVMFFSMMTQPMASVLLFYDGPNPPAGIFDAFLSLPFIMNDFKTRRFSDLVKSNNPSALFQNPRGRFQALPHQDITPQFINSTLTEVMSAASLTSRNNTFIGLTVEPFLPNILQHTQLPSAYPAKRDTAFLPFNLAAAWPDVESDGVYHQALKDIANRLRTAAVAQGQKIPKDAAMYPNYALYDTPLENIFGANLPKLRKMKKKIDPENVMGLAGGFKL
ncbi:hypothetical protein CVT24_008306 [Panaeolus cyanescens]|uniref:FAD-binding PCMH-type domain-containing protein n=1 Tax=Panaeolus cyanescens TaxID=181874 RepID=A0A409YLP0_9AGAR|nr:hypothetical protein CVT24_008306 [Panaeolus cyanescens]